MRISACRAAGAIHKDQATSGNTPVQTMDLDDSSTAVPSAAVQTDAVKVLERTNDRRHHDRTASARSSSRMLFEIARN